ncbi:unnamed protein product [Larinioides sclopetarius]|uniref:Uncharacterized protein n=1 Tax=Larinioides sclopetarius TaxID=280406 RepID=A0AAV1ZNB0_9ARAC
MHGVRPLQMIQSIQYLLPHVLYCASFNDCGEALFQDIDIRNSCGINGIFNISEGREKKSVLYLCID